VVNNEQVIFTTASAEQNAFSAADTFTIELPFFIEDNSTGDTIEANGPDFNTILLTQDQIPVQVYVGYPTNPWLFTTTDLVQVMDGWMDDAKFDFDDQGERVILTGRNQVGQLIDEKINDKLPNQTASSIATQFAVEHGLTPVVTPTTTLAGVYYNQNSAVMGTNDTSEWDLLLFLAQQENFICRVKGSSLYFGPYSVVTGYADQTPIPYTWGYDIETLEIERSPHCAKDIVVNVYTYARGSKTMVKETAKSTTQFAQKIFGQTGIRQQYVENYTIPGLTRDQAQKQAQAIATQLSSTQLIGNMTGAGNTELAIDRQIQINGVGKALSIAYYLTKVTHSMDMNGGYGIATSFCNQFNPSDLSEVGS
jgi:phage protein D